MKIPVIIIILLTLTKYVHLITRAVNELVLSISNEFQCGCIVIIDSHHKIWNKDTKFMVRTLMSGFDFRGKREFTLTGSLDIQDYYRRYLREDVVTAGNCYTLLAVIPQPDDRIKRFFIELSKKQPQLFSTSTWLFMLNNTDYFEEMSITVASTIKMAYLLEETQEVVVYDVYRVGTNLPFIVEKVGEWTPKTGLEIQQRGRWQELRGNLSGLVFRATTLENWPYSSFMMGEISEERKSDGLCVRIWKDLEQLTHFDTLLFRLEDAYPGTMLGNGTWVGALGLLKENKVDAVIAMVDITLRRLEIADYLYPLTIAKFQLYYQADGYQFDWLAVVRPFESDVWLVLVVWIFFWSVVYRVAFFIVNKYIAYKDNTNLILLDCFFFVLQVISFQGSPRTPKVWACRILFITTYLMSAILLPSYSASLISSLTEKTPLKPFDDLKGVLAANYRILMGNNGGEYEYFANCKDPICKELFEKRLELVDRTVTVEVADECLEIVCRNKMYAFFTNVLSDNWHTNTPKHCKIVHFTQSLGQVPQSIVLSSGSPYTKILNYYISRMFEVGVVAKHKYFYAIPPEKEATAFIPVKLIDVAEMFVLLGIGFALSLIILLWEHLIKYRDTGFKGTNK